MVGSLSDIITCAKFQDEIFRGCDFTRVEFSIFLLIFAWALQESSATVLPVISFLSHTKFSQLTNLSISTTWSLLSFITTLILHLRSLLLVHRGLGEAKNLSQSTAPTCSWWRWGRHAVQHLRPCLAWHRQPAGANAQRTTALRSWRALVRRRMSLCANWLSSPWAPLPPDPRHRWSVSVGWCGAPTIPAVPQQEGGVLDGSCVAGQSYLSPALAIAINNAWKESLHCQCYTAHRGRVRRVLSAEGRRHLRWHGDHSAASRRSHSACVAVSVPPGHMRWSSPHHQVLAS